MNGSTSLTDRIIARVAAELDRQRQAIDAGRDMQRLSLHVYFNSTAVITKVRMERESASLTGAPRT